MIRDLLDAGRRLGRAPQFTLVVVAVVALGVGANLGIFSLLEPLTLRSLPVDRPSDLVVLHSAGTIQTVTISERSAIEIYRRDRDALVGVAADAGVTEAPVTIGGATVTARVDRVSGNFFSVLGVPPAHGRLLSPGDEERATVGVLSDGGWKRLFGGDPSVVGRVVSVSGQPFAIVGIVPPGFVGLSVDKASDIFVPFESSPTGWVTVVARLRPGVSPDRARVLLEPRFREVVAASSLPAIEREQAVGRLLITPAGRGFSDLRDRFATPASVLMGVVGLLLLLALANVASLILTRASMRRTEFAIRAALGASRLEVVRPLLFEGVLIAAAGAAAGTVVALWIRAALLASVVTGAAPPHLSSSSDLSLVAFALALLVGTVVACGLAPALVMTRLPQGLDLRSRALTEPGVATGLLGRALIVVQVAASITLVATAGLLLHSFVNLVTADVGFDRARVVSIRLADSVSQRPSGQAADLIAALLDRAAHWPGVQQASLSTVIPLSGDEVGIDVAVEGRDPPAGTTHALFSSVTPGYFATMGIPIVAGRDFAPSDDPSKRPVAIISQTMARRYFGDSTPIGARLTFLDARRPPMEIVGVAADTTYATVRESRINTFYLCRPSGRDRADLVRGVLLLRASSAAAAQRLAGAAPAELAALAPAIRASDARTLDEYFFDSVAADRVTSWVSSLVGALAVVVLAIGLYGALAQRVTARSREIGLRMALGADAARVIGFVVRENAELALAGTVMGTAGATLAGQFVRSILFHVPLADVATAAGVVVLLAVVSVASSIVPARRALRVDPAVTLRGE